MIITTQPTAVSLVKLTRQLNGEISFFLTYDDNPNPNPTQDKAAVRTARRNIIRGIRSIRCHTAWKMISTYIGTVHASLSLHVVPHTTVHGMQLPRRNRTAASKPRAGIAGASRRVELAFVVQEGSFLRFLFPRGVHVLVGGDATTMMLSS